MKVRFQSTSDRLKLMSWHRRFCKSSPIQARQFVDSIPCEIEIDGIDYYFSDGKKQLKDIADFEILSDFPEIQPAINSCCFPTCGCEFQPEGFLDKIHF